jgi:hypothetical protein
VSANPGIPLGKPTDVPGEPQATISRPALTVVHSPAEQPVHVPGESAEDDGLAGMLASVPAIAIHARREQRRLRALAAQGAATPRQIVPFLARLERLAIHGAQLTSQVDWLCEDMRRDGLAHTPHSTWATEPSQR